jgi:dihydroxyacetone kinase-like protein
MAADDALDLEQLATVLCGVCDAMVDSIDDLTHADQAIGDGDHGLAIGRGFRAAREAIAGRAAVDVASVFEAMGLAMLTSMGGASGAIYGTLFRRGGRGLRGRPRFDAEALATFLEDGLAGVRERGGANVGDKTIVDALEPASAAARAAAGGSLADALEAAAVAAEQGLERTREMRATLGKAHTLGDRAIGHVDPGAMSFALMVRSLQRLVVETTGP